MLSELILLCLAGLLLACLFSGVETSLILANRAAWKKRAGMGDETALALFALLRHRERAQWALTVGFHLGLALGAAACMAWVFALAGTLWAVLSLWLYGMMVFVFQLVFRSAFRENGERLLLALTPWLRIWMWLAWPVVWLIGRLARALDATLGHAGKQAETMVSREFLHRMIEHGLMDREEKDILRRAARLGEKMVREVMIPRTDMVAGETTLSVDMLKDMFLDSGYSRIPIYKGSMDEIQGMVEATDLLLDPSSVIEVLRPIHFVPETKRVDGFLRECQQNGIQIAVVLDEYGGTAGLVTVEDLVEEIVGEIADEFDPDIKEYWVDRKGVLHVSAKMSLERANEALDLGLPDEGDVETMGGFVLKAMGCVPRPGEQLTFQDLCFTVVEADEQRIVSIRIEKKTGEGTDRNHDTSAAKNLRSDHPSGFAGMFLF